MEAFGAEVITVSSYGRGITPELIQEMKAICADKVQALDGFYADQFGSKDVVLGYEPMGIEIAGQIDQKVDLLCASVGTGGALMGTLSGLNASGLFPRTVAQIMDKALNDEQKARVLPEVASDPRCLLAIGITEPDNASNYFLPYPSSFRTTAEKTDGGWVVNGMKHFISNGNTARFYLLFVQTLKGVGLAEGSTCFLLERGHEGFSIGHVHDKMGERLANNAELIFQDCFIPDENVVGEPHKGFSVLANFFPQSNAYAGASITGVAEACFAKSEEWAKIRVQGGKPLIQHDGIRAQLAEMRMLIDASRSYIHRACWLADNQEHGWDKTLGALPKAMASQAAWKIATWTLEMHGGHGYMKEFGVAKLVRDAAAFLHSDGVNRTLFLKASNFMYDMPDYGQTEMPKAAE